MKFQDLTQGHGALAIKMNRIHKFFWLAIGSLLILLCPFETLTFGQDKDIYELSEEELKPIRELANSMPLKEAIGQLLVVGALVDANNYRAQRELKKFIEEYKVGNIFFASYHYPSSTDTPQTTIENIQNYHRYIRESYKAQKMPPPIFFVDFEGPRKSSFRNQPIIVPPAPPMALSASSDPQLIRLCGKYAGYQLRMLGVDAMLGPVLDVDGTQQGDRNEFMGVRSFGGNSQIVHNASSQYLFGLRDAGVLSFIKHYPGHGFVSGSEYGVDAYPTFDGCSENLLENLEPFKKLGPYATGILSANMVLPNVSSELAILSPQIMNDILRKEKISIDGGKQLDGLNLQNTILITDDLSNSGAIKKIMKEKKLGLPQIAIKAIDAGHDMLLFSHLETQKTINNPELKRGHFGTFGFDELSSIINEIERKAKDSQSFSNKLRVSLLRVLIVKAKLLKTWNAGQIHNLKSWSMPKREDGEISTPSFITNAKYKDADELLRTLLEKSYSHITPNQKKSDSFNSSILFVPERLSQYFESGIDNNPTITILPYKWPDNERKKDSEWRKLIETITTAVNDNNIDRIIYVFSGTGDDHSLLDHMAMKTHSNITRRSQIFILCHASPKWLPRSVLSGFQIVGNFSLHPLSFGIDKDFLNGSFRISDEKKGLPVSIGVQGEVSSDIIDISPATGLNPLVFSDTDDTKKVEMINKDLEKQLNAANTENKNYKQLIDDIYGFCRIFLGCVFFAAACYLLIKMARSFFRDNDVDENNSEQIKLVFVFIKFLLADTTRLASLISFFVCLIAGGLLVFNIGVSSLYSYVKLRIDTIIYSPSTSLQEPVSKAVKKISNEQG